MDKEQFKKELAQLLQGFFQEEQGNRVTSNNISGLHGKLMELLDRQKEPAKGKKSE